jgi:uncharacterized membrane protein
MMPRFEDTIEVDVPVRVAYDQWTQFHEFPQFMDGVESVTRLDAKTLAWGANIAGRRRSWKAEIVDQTPDVRVAWQSIDGGMNKGTVLFRSVTLDRTLVTLQLAVEPDGPMEALATPDGFLEGQVRGNLRRFKDLVEERLVPPGPWRGRVDPGGGTVHGTA